MQTYLWCFVLGWRGVGRFGGGGGWAGGGPGAWPGGPQNVVFPAASYPNTAQSFGKEPFGPGLMSFQKVKLPSAPNLYSSMPPFGLLALNHSALLNGYSGVGSGSPTTSLAGSGLKLVSLSVHCVTLPSFPNLNS